MVVKNKSGGPGRNTGLRSNSSELYTLSTLWISLMRFILFICVSSTKFTLLMLSNGSLFLNISGIKQRLLELSNRMKEIREYLNIKYFVKQNGAEKLRYGVPHVLRSQP